ncbi:MAG TPA: tetratricopeptide repeat-containing glycosyltransferase family protein [Acetobacteraceae bacterium]|jgi:Tfp pilus assembly protein PilF
MTSITDSLVELGQRAYDRGDMAEAENLFRRAHAAGRNDVEVLHFLGFLARARDDLTDAGNFYAAALARSPTDAQLHNNLAEVRRAQGRDAEAIALYRRATRLDPEKAEIHANLGSLLMALRRPEEALPSLDRALELNPTLLALHSDAAVANCALGRFEGALEHYQAAIRAQPSNANARYLEALALLALGDFSRGWRKHEARWYAELGQDKRRTFPQPYWLGEDSLAGRTILLHQEQGFGDTVQFLRYVPMVAARGATVLVEVLAPLTRLVAEMPNVAGVSNREEIPPHFDMHCSLMSMPRAFRTGIDTIPAAVPYLRAPPSQIAEWRDRLGSPRGVRRIAFAWSGSVGGAWNRNMDLKFLLPLFERTDCEFHVAQIGVLDEEYDQLRAAPGVIDHSRTIEDFADVAALVSLVDMVISVDTALAHLAGAMGSPVWTMLPLGADYRWMTHRLDTPWYPTMRLFRQQRMNDWPGVVADIGRALDSLPRADE